MSHTCVTTSPTSKKQVADSLMTDHRPPPNGH
jgi:hypothetical protein